MRAPTLAGQLLRAHVLVVAASCLVLVASALAGGAYLLRRTQDAALSALAGSLCHDVLAEAAENDLTVAAAAAEAFGEADLPRHGIELVATDGRPIVRHGLDLPADGTLAGGEHCDTPATTGRTRLRTCTSRCDDTGAIRIGTHDVLADSTTRLAAGTLIVVLPFAVAAGAVVGWRVVRRRLRPLTALRDAATLVEPGTDTSLGIGAGASELADLERTFDDLLSRVRDALERERLFSQQASHELRTPLTVIRGRLERLVPAAVDASRPGDELAVVLHEVRALERLVDGLLVLTRSDGAPLERAPVNLCDVARDLATRRAFLEGDGGRRIELDAPDEILVAGDESLLESALENLIENARRHGGPGVRVAVTVTTDNGRAVVRVEDDGPGMPEELRTIAFERFVRGSSPGRAPGTGLGLAVVRTVVRRHGGTVSAHRSRLGGEEIRVEIPLLRVS